MEFKTINLPENENLVVWEDRFAIGIPVIDNEHKRLVELCNELYKVVMSGDNSLRNWAVRIALRECADYINTHFAHEEQLMLLCGYKDFDMHKREHTEFSKLVLEKCTNFDHEDFHFALKLVKFLYGWILSHIAHTDRLFVDDLKAYLARGGVETPIEFL